MPHHFSGRLRQALFLLLALLLMLPVLSVFAAWLPWGDSSPESGQILLEMSRTVLPDYALTTLWLCLLVAAGVSLIGLSAAVAVTLFEFPADGCWPGPCCCPGHAGLCGGLCLH